MTARNLRTAVACCILLAGFTISQLVSSDPCLIVYPGGPCLYWYDPSEYYTVAPGHPFYDPAYDRGGTVLLEIGTNQVDVSIYQAPGLLGFVVSTNGQDGYHFTGSDFQLIVDGFSNVPTTYSNILIVFDKVVPAGCAPTIRVGGAPLSGGVYHAGDLLVQTPTPNGNNYSDTITLPVSSTGCTFIHVWAFSDADHDNAKDGGECFTAFSHDIVVPVENSSWGRIKVMYR